MADLFHVICGVALRPFVFLYTSLNSNVNQYFRLSAIPGSVEGALTPAARLRQFVTCSVWRGDGQFNDGVQNNVTAWGILGSWGAPWVGWLAGRRDL